MGPVGGGQLHFRAPGQVTQPEPSQRVGAHDRLHPLAIPGPRVRRDHVSRRQPHLGDLVVHEPVQRNLARPAGRLAQRHVDLRDLDRRRRPVRPQDDRAAIHGPAVPSEPRNLAPRLVQLCCANLERGKLLEQRRARSARPPMRPTRIDGDTSLCSQPGGYSDKSAVEVHVHVATARHRCTHLDGRHEIGEPHESRLVRFDPFGFEEHSPPLLHPVVEARLRQTRRTPLHTHLQGVQRDRSAPQLYVQRLGHTARPHLQRHAHHLVADASHAEHVGPGGHRLERERALGTGQRFSHGAPVVGKAHGRTLDRRTGPLLKDHARDAPRLLRRQRNNALPPTSQGTHHERRK